MLHAFIVLIHLSFLGLAALGIYAADHQALDWMRGKRKILRHHVLTRTHQLVTIGLSGLVLTGLYLFWPVREYLFAQPLFWLKMAFVMALLINSFFIERLMPLAGRYEFSRLHNGQKLGLLLSGAISSASWLGAVGAALLLFA